MGLQATSSTILNHEEAIGILAGHVPKENVDESVFIFGISVDHLKHWMTILPLVFSSRWIWMIFVWRWCWRISTARSRCWRRRKWLPCCLMLQLMLVDVDCGTWSGNLGNLFDVPGCQWDLSRAELATCVLGGRASHLDAKQAAMASAGAESNQGHSSTVMATNREVMIVINSNHGFGLISRGLFNQGGLMVDNQLLMIHSLMNSNRARIN